MANLNNRGLKTLVTQIKAYVTEKINKFSETVIDVKHGGTGSTTEEGARKNLGLGSVATEDTVPVSKGGTGKTSHTTNSVLVGNNKDGVKNVASKKGALYATSSNYVPQFGTLPVNCGGTGVTTKEDIQALLSVPKVQQETATFSIEPGSTSRKITINFNNLKASSTSSIIVSMHNITFEAGEVDFRYHSLLAMSRINSGKVSADIYYYPTFSDIEPPSQDIQGTISCLVIN